MAVRRLTPDEQTIWGKVAQSVRPLPGRSFIVPDDPRPQTPIKHTTKPPRAGVSGATPVAPAPKAQRRPADYLDGGWERRIASGTLRPDAMIDLHGYSLDAAHRHLESALHSAVMRGARVLLVVTGKARTGAIVPGERPRGVIRAEIGHWLATSAHADGIASVRNAHPRHGGGGALYVILRRPR